MLAIHIRFALVALTLGACTTIPTPNLPRSEPNPKWEFPAEMSDGHRNFVTLSLSGGGAKAATFSAEVMFYLQSLGLLQKVSLISSVSGGSFAGAIYALSCDEGQQCSLKWSYDNVMQIVTSGYGPLVWRAGTGLLLPFARPDISAQDFSEFVERTYFKHNDTAHPYTFADLNPARPRLVLNTTLVSQDRAALEFVGQEPIGHLRRRTADELFNFAFTPYYFDLIRSDWPSFPVSYAVAASAAFPALIDYAGLTDFYAKLPDQKSPVKLYFIDGGANDNQGLIEVHAIVSELMGRQSRTGIPLAYKLAVGDKLVEFVVNASLTEATGADLQSKEGSVSWWYLLGLDSIIGDFGIANRVSSATDTYSAVSYNLRKQLYILESALVQTKFDFLGLHFEPFRDQPHSRPIEVSIAGLNQYPVGGLEAYLAFRSHYADGEPKGAFDLGRALHQAAAINQRHAFNVIKQKSVRDRLGLPRFHPQCYFEKAKTLDTQADIAGLTAHDSACIRQAARWATALRAQELCDEMQDWRAPFVPGTFAQCVGGQLFLNSGVLGPLEECNSETDFPIQQTPFSNATNTVLSRRFEEPADGGDSTCQDLDTGRPAKMAWASETNP